MQIRQRDRLLNGARRLAYWYPDFDNDNRLGINDAEAEAYSERRN